MTAPPLDPTGADRRMRVLYVTAGSAEEARRLGEGAVRARLAACANSWPIHSVYWWKGKVERAGEHAILLKSSAKKLGALMRYLAREHSYEVPDLFEIPAPRVHEPYVRWVLASLDPESQEPPAGAPARRRGSRRARAAPSRRRTRAQPHRPY